MRRVQRARRVELRRLARRRALALAPVEERRRLARRGRPLGSSNGPRWACPKWIVPPLALQEAPARPTKVI